MKNRNFFDFEEVRAGYTKEDKTFSFNKSFSSSHSSNNGFYFKSQSSGVTNSIKAIKEVRKSSINFQKAKNYSYSHNFRVENEKLEAKYLLPEEFRQENEYWILSNEKGEIRSAGEVYLEEIKKTKRKGGANPKFENAHREAVVVLNSHHTMEDLHKIREYFEKKYKFICCAMTIHRDEGEVIEIKGEKIPKYNYHAHLNFITYANGKQQWNFNKKQLADMQTEISEILGMERGESAQLTKKKHLKHQHYRYMKQQEAELENENDFISQQNRGLQEEIKVLKAKNQDLELELTNQSKRKKFWGEYRQKLIQEGGYTQQDYQVIRAIIMDSENDYKSVLKAIDDYKELKQQAQKPQIEVREIEKEVIKEVEKPLTQEQIEKIQSPLKQELAKKEQELSEVIQNTTQEIKSLKIENESLKSEKESSSNDSTIDKYHKFLVWWGHKKEGSDPLECPQTPRTSPQKKQEAQSLVKKAEALTRSGNGISR